MRRRTVVLLVLASAVALVCARLGLWQLSRLADRRAANALVASRLDSAVVGVERVPADTAASRFRRVAVRGTFDFAHEVVLAGRSRNGSPGVNFLTPLRLAGRDTAILVNRGWVYSPDAARVDAARWREPAAAEIVGFVNAYHDPSTGPAQLGTGRTIRRLDPAALDTLVPYPLARFHVVATSAPLDSATAPVRLAPPPLDEGSHAGYAFQWFTFAAVALGGAIVLAVHDRRRLTAAAPSPSRPAPAGSPPAR